MAVRKTTSSPAPRAKLDVKPEIKPDIKPDVRGHKRLADITLDDLDARAPKRPSPSFSGADEEEIDEPPEELLARIRDMSSQVRPGGGEDALTQGARHGAAVLFGQGGSVRVNYDSATPVSRIDVGGPDQDKKLAEFVSKGLDSFASQMTVKQGMEYLGMNSLRDLLPGLEVRLLPHQIIGVAWMLMQERGDHARIFPSAANARPATHNGGILADDMGLGKTVQMIATMVANTPDVDERVKTTLIVVPAALLHQWKEELNSKSNGIFDVWVYHGKDKLKTVEAVKEKDVIITTYQTLNIEYGVPRDVADEDRLPWLQDHGGVLSKMKWHRVVLDEAHMIRNRATTTSQTVALVRSKYRWMLTGTPVINSLADVYGLLRFGKFRPWNDWKSFEDHIAKVQNEDAVLAGQRAQSILKPLLLRRCKNGTLEGKPLLELPPKHIEIITGEFSTEERAIYDHLEGKAVIEINRFIRAGTLVKNSAYVLVLILRLRQLCCHPNLILDRAGEGEDGTSLMSTNAQKEADRATKEMGKRWVDDVKRRFMSRARAKQLDWSDGSSDADEFCPKCSDPFVGGNGRVLACGHEICNDCLQDLQNSGMEHNGVFGTGDEKTTAKVEKKFEDAHAKGLRPCPTRGCDAMNDLRPHRVFLSAAFEPAEDELDAFVAEQRAARRAGASAARAKAKPAPVKAEKKVAVTVATFEVPELSDSDEDMPDVSALIKSAVKQEEDVKPKKEKSKGKGKAMRILDSSDEEEESDDSAPKGKAKGKAPAKAGGAGQRPSQHTLDTWRRGDSDLEPSTKMLALIKLLKEADNAGDKTIVYSQWTSMLDLVENLFARYGIRTLRYDGGMSRELRERALREFRTPGSPKVMLISIRSGGVGLNLVSANRVVNMDLSWNYAAESQAYDRVHRLGQDKEVHISRLVVANTIEERMLRLQDVKTGLSDAALGEGTGMKLSKLSVKEIKQLFGMSRPDPAPAANQRTLD